MHGPCPRRVVVAAGHAVGMHASTRVHGYAPSASAVDAMRAHANATTHHLTVSRPLKELSRSHVHVWSLHRTCCSHRGTHGHSSARACSAAAGIAGMHGNRYCSCTTPPYSWGINEHVRVCSHLHGRMRGENSCWHVFTCSFVLA